MVSRKRKKECLKFTYETLYEISIPPDQDESFNSCVLKRNTRFFIRNSISIRNPETLRNIKGKTSSVN